ncbi:hypothetical protein ACRRTK_002234 [Alexandromys fortis]
MILSGQDPITGVKLKGVECHSVQRNQWARVAPVPHSFYSFELIVVQNYLYTVNSKRMLCYDPSHNMWLNCASLKWSNFQEACVFKDEIYCICDITGMKVYNPAKGEWRGICNIPLDSETHNYQVINHNKKTTPPVIDPLYSAEETVQSRKTFTFPWNDLENEAQRHEVTFLRTDQNNSHSVL